MFSLLLFLFGVASGDALRVLMAEYACSTAAGSGILLEEIVVREGELGGVEAVNAIFVLGFAGESKGFN